MSSKSSSESTPSVEEVKKDMGVVIDRYNKLATAHKQLANNTADVLDAWEQLAESQQRRLVSDNKRLNWLTFALIVQAVYLIIFL